MADENVLKNIGQVSKTLIFEKFTDEAKDLKQIITSDDAVINQYLFDNIEKELEVRTFAEFEKRFSPYVYEWTEGYKDKEGNVISYSAYSFNKDMAAEGACRTRLADTDYYKNIMRIFNSETVNNQAVNKQDVAKALQKFINPKEKLEEIKEQRKLLQDNMIAYKNATTEYEKNKYYKQLNVNIAKTAEIYSNKNAIYSLMIADTHQLLLGVGGDKDEKPKDDDNGDKPQLRLCSTSFDDNGDIKVEFIETTNDKSSEGDGDKNELSLYKPLETALVKCFEANSPDKSEYLKAVALRVMLPKEKEKPNPDKVRELQKQYIQKYTESLSSQISTISDAIVKMLGVKAYFDNALHGVLSELNPPLIIANCNVDSFRKEEEFKKLENFLKVYTKEKDTRIWYAVVPDLVPKDENLKDPRMGEEEKIADYLPREMLDKNIGTVSDNNTEATTTIIEKQAGHDVAVYDAQAVVKTLAENKIVTFINFKSSKKTAPELIGKEIVELYEKELDSYISEKYSDHIVFCFPQFIVIPESESEISIGDHKLVIPPVYVDASYVAAGMTAAHIEPEILKKIGFKDVERFYPGIRFSFEDGDNKYKFTTTMPRQTKKGGMRLDLEQKISENKFGYVFSSNPDSDGVTKSVVYQTRTLKFNEKTNTYKPLFNTVIKDFMEAYITVKVGAENMKKRESIKNFFKDVQNIIGEWNRVADSGNTVINSILYSGDRAEFDLDEFKLKLKLAKDEEPIDFEIEDE